MMGYGFFQKIYIFNKNWNYVPLEVHVEVFFVDVCF